jgi:hypothetical protein
METTKAATEITRAAMAMRRSLLLLLSPPPPSPPVVGPEDGCASAMMPGRRVAVKLLRGKTMVGGQEMAGFKYSDGRRLATERLHEFFSSCTSLPCCRPARRGWRIPLPSFVEALVDRA